MARTKAADRQAAKAAKQKKIAIVGVALLVPLLAIQVPRTMKMLGGGEPVEAAALPAPATGAPEPVSLAPPALGEPMPSPDAGGAPAVEPPAAEGTLVSFERFESKDPFAAQIRAGDGSAGAQPAAGSQGAGEALPAAPGATGTSSGTPGAPTRAELEVNGEPVTVESGTEFPTGQAVFRLAAVRKGSVEIGIAGGSLATGDATVKLAKGETLTLVNTADGTRYRLKLLSVS